MAPIRAILLMLISVEAELLSVMVCEAAVKLTMVEGKLMEEGVTESAEGTAGRRPQSTGGMLSIGVNGASEGRSAKSWAIFCEGFCSMK